jgi:hypothetical protein
LVDDIEDSVTIAHRLGFMNVMTIKEPVTCCGGISISFLVLRGVFGWDGCSPGIEETIANNVLVRVGSKTSVAKVFAQDCNSVQI